MLTSMTGYGETSLETENWKIDLYLRSLNGKFFDCTLRLPRSLEAREMDIRKILSKTLLRGKLFLSLQCHRIDSAALGEESLNEELFQHYWRMLKKVSSHLGASVSDNTILSAVVRMPGMMRAESGPENEEASIWASIQEPLQQVILGCQQMQQKEGEQTSQLISHEIELIEQLLRDILLLEPQRGADIQQKLRKKVDEALAGSYSEERLAQELFFYIERMDFTEEKDRLQQHLAFFKDILADSSPCEAKRLLFITQEIGREINTLGTKSHHATIQQQVVHMKSALEQIKEQLQNLK